MNIAAKFSKNILRVVLFLILIISYLFISDNVSADVEPIPEPYVTCSDVRSDQNDPEGEFHSLRPYQASPCEVPVNFDDFGSEAQLCGNDLKVRDNITAVPQEAEICRGCNAGGPCDGGCNSVSVCHYELPRDFDISINPSSDSYPSKFPIAGNTELVAGKEEQSVWKDLLVNLLTKEKELRLSFWRKANRLPPDVNDYDNFQDYYFDYQEWRGKDCKVITIPFTDIKIGFCFDSPLNPNYWSKLFPYIPYSSTEDRSGIITTSDMIFIPGESSAAAKDLETRWREKEKDARNANTANNQSVNYFAHMEENVELASLLQSTYLPPEILEKEQPIGETKKVDIGKQCKILEVRYNPGDKTFGEEIIADVSYKAVFDHVHPNIIIPLPFGGKLCIPTGVARRYTTFYSTIDTQVPMIDELWSKTVAGNASIFKKIFPKIGEGAPVTEIKDIPGVSDLDHNYKDGNSNISQLSPEPAEIYFPHLGGIYDYFLHMIQTAIRPKGFEAQPAGLPENTRIPKVDTVNEYVSWYLNGTEYRAENDPLTVEEEDIYKVVNLTGPVNKLLSQHSQWRNVFKFNSPSYPEKDIKLGKVDQTLKAGKDNERHDQIAACVLMDPIFGLLGGFPVACVSESQKDGRLPPETGTTPGVPPGTQCVDRTSDLANDTVNSSCKLSQSSINGISIPDNLRKVFEAAGAKYGVPPDLIAGVMFSEGGFNPETQNPNSCYGPYTKENIDLSIKCEFPHCQPPASPMCRYTVDAGNCSHAGPFQQKRCPGETGGNRCNIYDAAMDTAAGLAQARYGHSNYPGAGDGSISCIDYDYNTGSITGSLGCQKSNWSCNDVITAIRQETGSCIDWHFCDVLKVYGQCNSSCP